MSINLLQAADPARDHVLPSSLDDRAVSDLDAILKLTPAPGTTSSRRLRKGLVAAAVAGLLVLGVGVISLVHRPPVATATSVALPILQVAAPVDPVAAGTRLNALAALAAAAPPTSAVDPVHYLAWSLNARIDGQTTNTAIVSTDHLVDIAADRSGTDKVTVASIAFPTQASRTAWAEDPQATVGQVVRDDSYDSGQYPSMYSGPTPTDPVALRRFLSAGHPIDAYGPGELFVAVTDLAQERRLGRSGTSTTLRMLAKEPGVMSLGTVTDRNGRSGVAVAADGDFTGLPTRWVLIFDPATGGLLASETWLTTSAGSLGIQAPAAVDYRLFLTGGGA